MKAKIILDEKHVCSAHLKDRTLNISINNITKVMTSPRFIKLALSLKATTSNTFDKTEELNENILEHTTSPRKNQEQKKSIAIKLDTNIIKGIFKK